MRIFLLTLFLAAGFSAPTPAVAQDSKILRYFDAGTALLVDGQFSDALEQFEHAERLGWGSTELYFNIALAYHRLDNLGQSIRYLERAKILSPNDPKVNHSLNLAKSRRVDNFSELPKPFWRRAHSRTTRVLPIDVSFWTGFMAYVILITLVLAKIILRRDGSWWRRGRFAAGMVGAALLIHAFATSAWPPLDQKAVVLAGEVALLEQADAGSNEVIRVHEGVVVIKRAEASDFTFVQIPNGERGWVPSSVLGSI